MQPSFPDKTYYKIGEVAKLADLKSSVLRFWESEFSFLCPEKSSSGQRLYTKQDIETIQQIKQLLYQEKYTIEGVRKRLTPRRARRPEPQPAGQEQQDLRSILWQIKQELTNLRATL
jgi:DNA-binding transcriptional MerR regulator